MARCWFLILSVVLCLGCHSDDPKNIGQGKASPTESETVKIDKTSRSPALQDAAPPAATASSQTNPASLKNSIGMEFIPISPGKFMMGSEFKTKRPGVTMPVHEVTLTEPFHLGVYEVTQQQFERVMGMNPTRVKGQADPASAVSWSDAVTFCEKLSAMPAERSAGRVYRLPTEAEWEYACRAGTTTEYCFGDDASKLGEYGWFVGNSGNSVIDFQALGPTEKVQAVQNNNNRLRPVGTKKPNAWGLYDMHGNMWEWCQDHYAQYTAKAVTDPINPAPGTTSESSGNPVDQILNAGRVVRGGGWRVYAAGCRSAYRNSNDPSLRGPVNGFRVALSTSGEPPANQ